MIKEERLTIRPARRSRGVREWFDPFAALVRKEFTISARYPVELLASFLQVFLITAIFTLATLTFAGGEGEGSVGDGWSLQGIVAYGFIPFIFFTRTLWDIGFNIRREQLQGTLESVFLSPVSQAANLLSRVVLTVISVTIMSALAVLLMVALMGRLPFHNAGLGLYILVMTLLATFGFGFLFAALTLRVRETAQTLANAGQFAFMVFCAPFYPFSALPEWAQLIARCIPLSYGVDAMRSAFMGFPGGFPELAPLRVELLIVTITGLGMPILGLWLYQRAEQRARQKGTLGVY